jgi:head-tail adaptor
MSSSGAMRERVTFLRSARTQRTDGGYDVATTELATVWAAVRPVQAGEREQAGRLFGATSYLVEIWADDKPSALTTDDTLRWDTAPGGAVSLNVRAIRQAPRRAMALELVCEAGAVL